MEPLISGPLKGLRGRLINEWKSFIVRGCLSTHVCVVHGSLSKPQPLNFQIDHTQKTSTMFNKCIKP